MWANAISGSVRVWRYIVEHFAGALALIGVVAAVAITFSVDDYAERVNKASLRPSSEDTETAFEVRDSRNQPTGWLRITYQSVMRDDEETELKVAYFGDSNGGWQRGRRDPREVTLPKLSVSVRSCNLALQPEPKDYTFNLNRIQQVLSDQRTWTVSALKTGDWKIIVRFDASKGFQTRSVLVNSTQLEEHIAEVALAVNVYKPYRVPELTLDAMKIAGTIASFLLTLPLLSILLTWYLEKKKRRKKA
jgi:hypothetical protein